MWAEVVGVIGAVIKTASRTVITAVIGALLTPLITAVSRLSRDIG
jgi:hypothetical protein